MKKILSVVLAGAMILGMSVSAFADKADQEFGAGVDGVELSTDVKNDIAFNWAYVERDGDIKSYDNKAEAEIEAGDVLYFLLEKKGVGTPVKSEADEDWRIKINNAEFVEGAEFFYDEDAKIVAEPRLYAKVTLEDDFDHYEEDEVKFYFYIYDTENKKESDHVKVAYDFAGYNKETLDREDLNWVVTVDEPTTYTYKKGEKSGYATIDFNGEAYAEFKMYSGEKYTLSSEVKYNKDLSKEYDTDVEVVTFRMKNVENADILFPSDDEDMQVVAIVDGEFVAVDAEYVEDYKFESGEVVDGYIVEDAEHTSYALIDADIEIEVEEDKDDEEKPSSGKDNPAMGANDFVGAAVALAVVSVAAAGALALKK